MTDNGFSTDEPQWLAAERAGRGGSPASADGAVAPADPVAASGAGAAADSASGEPAGVDFTATATAADRASGERAAVESAAAATAPEPAGPSDPATSGAAASASAPGGVASPAEPAAVALAEPAGAVSKASIADIEEAMKDVVDPELGINVVDLGLVYDTFVDDDNVATLDMTLTSAACPLTDVIEDQTRAALTTGPGGGLVKDFRINWVWLPPWGPDKITDDGREQLRALGFNV